VLRGFGLRRACLAPEPALRAPDTEIPSPSSIEAVADTVESEWAPEAFDAGDGPLPGSPRRIFTWKRALAAVFLMAALGAGAAYSQKERIAPEVADMSRRLIGDERTARIEGWFFKVEDKIDKTKYRLFGGATNPFATQQVRVDFVRKPAIREVFYFVGDGSDDLPPPDAFVPLPMRPPLTKPLRDTLEAGEGAWTTAGLPLSPPNDPLMMKTFIRPDTSRPYALVGVLLLDHRRIRLHMVGGTVDPGGDRGVKGPGLIPEGDVGELLAAWNGGFKGPHGGFGMIANGLTYRPLRNGLATLCVATNGTMKMGEFGRDFTWSDSFEACRRT